MSSTVITPKIAWPRADVLALCRSYGPLVEPIEEVNPVQLLAAMAMNESSLGDNCTPRYEPRYDSSGSYGANEQQRALLVRYGQLAAYSYGPLQIMLVNTGGCSPADMNTNLPLAMRVSISFLNIGIRHHKPANVAEVGMLWNGGHVMRAPEEVPGDVRDYVRQLLKNYDQAAIWIQKG